MPAPRHGAPDDEVCQPRLGGRGPDDVSSARRPVIDGRADHRSPPARSACPGQPGRPRRHRRLQVGHQRRPVRTSSGRTDGVTCRTTRSSIAHPTAASLGRSPAGAPDSGQGEHRRAGRRRCAGPAWSAARPAPRRRPGRPSPPRRPSRRRRRAARCATATPPSGRPGCRRSASTARPARPGRARVRRPGRPRTWAGSTYARSADLQVLGLAGHPGRRRAGVGDLRVRGEALGVRDGYPGPLHRPLEGAGEVPVRGEPQRPALGVPDADPLHHRRLVGLRLVPGDDALL